MSVEVGFLWSDFDKWKRVCSLVCLPALLGAAKARFAGQMPALLPVNDEYTQRFQNGLAPYPTNLPALPFWEATQGQEIDQNTVVEI